MWILVECLIGEEIAGPVLVIVLLLAMAGPFWTTAQSISEALTWWQFGFIWSFIVMILFFLNAILDSDDFDTEHLTTLQI
jgi:hypothetical protein